jgi:hypothetical protein
LLQSQLDLKAASSRSSKKTAVPLVFGITRKANSEVVHMQRYHCQQSPRLMLVKTKGRRGNSIHIFNYYVSGQRRDVAQALLRHTSMARVYANLAG